MSRNCQAQQETSRTRQEQLRPQSLEPKKTTRLLKSTDIANLFQSKSPSAIRELLFDPNDAIALCAAWKRLENEMGALVMQPGAASKRMRLPAEVSSRFLAFVEGRLHIPAPEGWSKSINQATYSGDLERVFIDTGWERLARQSDEMRRTELRSFPYSRLSFSRFPDRPTIEFEAGGIGTGITGYSFVSADAPDWIREKPSPSNELMVISAIASRERVFYVNPGDDRLDCELICQSNAEDSPTKILWRTKLDPSWIDDKGIVSVHSELRIADDCLFVFHYTELSVGIESLRVEDGQRIFSFNSSWRVK